MNTLKRLHVLLAFLALASAPLCHAQRAPFESALSPDRGKLPLTAGFTDIDGAGGAGLVPFALITGYGTDQSGGANGTTPTFPCAISGCRATASRWACWIGLRHRSRSTALRPPRRRLTV